jgi:4-oxalocrotonate tautomerase
MEARMPEVVVYLLEGRSLEQKRGLVKDITQAVVKNAGTTADQVTVSLVETPRTSKAKGGVLFSRNGRPLGEPHSRHEPIVASLTIP